MNQEKKIISVEAVRDKLNSLADNWHEDTENIDVEGLINDMINSIDQFQNPPAIKKCDCDPDKKTGETEMLVMCCNICGKPDDGAIGRIGTPAIKLPSELEDYINEQLESELELRSEFNDHNSYAFGHSSGCTEAYNNILNYIKQSK